MAEYTNNLNLEKPSYNETADIEVINKNMDIIDSEMIYKTATGTGNAIIINLPKSIVNGYNCTFIASANNGGAATTINGKKLYKPNTTTAPNIANGKAYSIWYNAASDCFFIQASAEGNAPISSVLAGATFSNDNDTGLVGTMPNNGVMSGTLNAGGSKVIPSGYTTGGTVTANSLANQTIATAVAGQMLSGATAWVNGAKVTGNIPTAGATYSDQRQASSISTGNYSGDGQISTYFGVPNGHFLNGVNWIKYPTPYLQPQNIVKGANILGTNGTASIESMGGVRFASGTIITDSTECAVINIGFNPTLVITANGKYLSVAFDAKFCGIAALVYYIYPLAISNNRTPQIKALPTTIPAQLPSLSTGFAVGNNSIYVNSTWAQGNTISYWALQI